MKGTFRGLQNTTTRFPPIGNTLSALTGLLVFFSTTAFGQVVLDDFSTDNRLKYAFAPVFPPDALDGWAVTGGELRPSMAENASATWLWNQGQKLSAPGDSVSISLSLPAHANNVFDTSIGLYVAIDTVPNGGHFISLKTSGGSWFYSADGFDIPAAASPPTGSVQLTIQRTGDHNVDGFLYTTTFSGGGLLSPLTDPDLTFRSDADSLLFGPYAENTAGTAAALDNFTFTPVPEPSMYAAVFGFLALTTAVIRRRTARRS